MVDNLDMEMDFLDFTIKVLLLSNIEFVLKSTFSDFFFISIVISFVNFGLERTTFGLKFTALTCRRYTSRWNHVLHLTFVNYRRISV